MVWQHLQEQVDKIRDRVSGAEQDPVGEEPVESKQSSPEPGSKGRPEWLTDEYIEELEESLPYGQAKRELRQQDVRRAKEEWWSKEVLDIDGPFEEPPEPPNDQAAQ